jgi:cytochrome b subunit of formate dehydrogenase
MVLYDIMQQKIISGVNMYPLNGKIINLLRRDICDSNFRARYMIHSMQLHMYMDYSFKLVLLGQFCYVIDLN